MPATDDLLFAARLGQLMDSGIETLRWCRQHTGERGVAEKLHALQLSIAAMTLALSLEMDGDLHLALEALALGDWDAQIRELNGSFVQERPE